MLAVTRLGHPSLPPFRRFEQDGETINRLLVTGRDCVDQTLAKARDPLVSRGSVDSLVLTLLREKRRRLRRLTLCPPLRCDLPRSS